MSNLLFLLFLFTTVNVSYQCILVPITTVTISASEKYRYTIHDTRYNSIIVSKYITDTSSIQENTVCLHPNIMYSIKMTPVNDIRRDDIGLILCNTIFIESYNSVHFYIDKNNNCINPRPALSGYYSSMKLSTIEPSSYSHRFNSMTQSIYQSSLSRQSAVEPPGYSYHFSSMRQSTSEYTSYSYHFSSMGPTLTHIPSHRPTTITNVPTITITTASTHIPTTIPTASTRIPTTNQPSSIQPIPSIIFDTSITLRLTSNSPYDNQTKLAICTATTNIINVHVDTCTYQGTTFSSQLETPAASAHLLSIYSATSVLSILIPTTTPIQTLYNTISQQLSTAASDGTFTAQLVSACQLLGVVNAVSTATVIGATVLIITIPPTYSPTISSNIEAGNMTPESIAGIIIGGLAFIVTVMACLSKPMKENSNRITLFMKNPETVKDTVDEILRISLQYIQLSTDPDEVPITIDDVVVETPQQTGIDEDDDV